MAKKNRLNSIINFLSKNYLLAGLFIFGILLRLIFFKGQVWLGSDITRDISISLEALKRHEIPLTGSFSSAGPFVFGPTLYWLYMITFALFPLGLLTPWYTAIIIGLCTMVLFYYLIKKLGISQVVGLGAVVLVFSPQLVLSSSSPTQHTYVLILTLLALLFLAKLFDNGRLLWAMLAGAAIGLSINMHYQAVNLLILPFSVIFFERLSYSRRLVSLTLVLVGMVIALLPLTLWDSGQAYANYRNLLDYLLIGQGRIYVPNSWKLYVLDYLPGYWEYVTGIPGALGLLILFTGSIFTALQVIRRVKMPFVFLLNSVFLLLLLLGRYYRGERFPGYTMYMLPFIIIFSIWTVGKILDLIPNTKTGSKVKYLVVVLLSISIVLASYSHLRQNLAGNTSYTDVGNVVMLLSHKYPGKKFRVLNLAGTNPDASFAVAVYLQDKDLYSFENAVYVGFCVGCFKDSEKLGELFGTSYAIVDNHTNGDSWQGVSQAEIYDSTIGWLNKHQLQSTFMPGKYIKERLFR